METRWSDEAAFVLLPTFLTTCTQFLRYWHCRIKVVQLVQGGEIAPDVLVMSLSLVVHLCLHRGSCLNVFFVNGKSFVGKPGHRRVGSEEGDAW